MTRLSSYPFAKSLLALSLSAVFSSAALAAQQVEFTDDYSVTINGEVQTTPKSADTNPLQTENQWWSTTAIQGNEIKFSAVREEEKIALVTEDILGGFGSAGMISNNKIVTDAEEGALSLSGNIFGGIADYGDDVSVKDNVVDFEGVVLGYIPEDEELKLRMIPSIVGGAAASSNFTEDGPQLNISVTGNEVIITNSEITAAAVAGGMVQAKYKDNAQANKNRVIFDDVKSIEENAICYVFGGRVDAAINAQANENEVLLEDSSVTLISGGYARGVQAKANGNIVELSNVSAQAVIGAIAQSRTEGDGGAQAIGNRLTWINTNEEEVSLGQFTVASAMSYTGSTVVSGNQASINGLKTKAFEYPEVRLSGSLRFGLGYDGSVGFLSESEEGEATLTDNQLKIENSQLSDTVTVGEGSGKNVVLSGNYLNVINSQIQDLGGYFAIADDNANVFGNIIDINGLTANQFLAFAVAGSKTVVQGNEMTVENSSITRVGGVVIAGRSFDSDGNETTEISDNRITFKNLSTPNEPSNSTRPITKSEVEFLSVSRVADVSVRDNYFEVIEVNDSRTFVGTNLSIDENIKNVDIQNNTLLVKDSTIDGVVGISVIGLGNVSEDQLNLKNNTIILDNSNVGYVSSFGQKIRTQPKQNGTLVLRGHNEVGVAPVGFNDWQFDLGTAENDTPMLTITGADTNTIKDQTLVLTNGDQASVDDITLINTQDGSMSLSAENVVLQVRDTFTFKSLDVNAVFDGNGFQLSDYYEELMKQKDQAGLGTLTLSDSQLATIALTRQSSEEALNLLQSAENLSPDAPMKGFASVSGSSNFYELGTGFDLNGTSLTVGGALRINDKWSGVGFANFSDANADSTVEGFRGDSDMKTYSAGVALRYQTEMPFYTEGALVVGQADTEFVGSYTSDTARYDSKRFYTTAQLGVGSDFALSDNVNLNVYGRYSFTYLDGDKVALNNATRGTFDVDDTMVHAMRVGARVKGSVAPNVQWFAGAAFERVLDGDVEAMVKDAKLKTETLKGNVGIFEVGATLAPNDLGPWTMDVKAGAYAGDRRGVSGSVSVNYVF